MKHAHVITHKKHNNINKPTICSFRVFYKFICRDYTIKFPTFIESVNEINRLKLKYPNHLIMVKERKYTTKGKGIKYHD